MSNDDLESLIEARAEKRALALLAKYQNKMPEDGESLYKVGRNILIRTVTHIQTGRITYLSEDEIGLEDAAWVASTGRFSDALKTGELDEVEPCDVPCSVGRGAIVDAFLWVHPLPRDQK